MSLGTTTPDGTCRRRLSPALIISGGTSLLIAPRNGLQLHHGSESLDRPRRPICCPMTLQTHLDVKATASPVVVGCHVRQACGSGVPLASQGHFPQRLYDPGGRFEWKLHRHGMGGCRYSYAFANVGRRVERLLTWILVWMCKLGGANCHQAIRPLGPAIAGIALAEVKE